MLVKSVSRKTLVDIEVDGHAAVPAELFQASAAGSPSSTGSLTGATDSNRLFSKVVFLIRTADRKPSNEAFAFAVMSSRLSFVGLPAKSYALRNTL